MKSISIFFLLLLLYIPLQAQKLVAARPYVWAGNIGEQTAKLCHPLSENSFLIPEKPSKDQVDLVAYRSDYSELWRLAYPLETKKKFEFKVVNRFAPKYYHPFISMEVINNRVHLLLSAQDGQLVYQIIDGATGTEVSSKVLAKLHDRDHITFKYSKNKEYFMLSIGSKQERELTFSVHTNTGNPVKTITTAETSRTPVIATFVSDAGDFYLIQREEDKTFMLNRFEASSEGASPDAVTALPKFEKNFNLVDIQERENKLSMFFNAGAQTTTYLFNPETNKLLSNWTFEADKHFLKQLYGRVTNKRLWRNAKPSPPDLYLSLDKVVPNTASSNLLIYETKYLEAKSGSAARVGFGTVYAEDVVLVCVDQNGKVLWSNYIDKFQRVLSGDFENAVSYEHYRSDENTHLFFTAEAESTSVVGCYIRKLDAHTGKISEPLMVLPTRSYAIRKLSCWLTPQEMIITTMTNPGKNSDHQMHRLRMNP